MQRNTAVKSNPVTSNDCADPLIMGLEPIMHMLRDPSTEDVAFNKPQVAWRFAAGKWEEHAVPTMTLQHLRGIGRLAAFQVREHLSAANPIVSVDVLDRYRLQVVVEPAVPPGMISHTYRRPSELVAAPEDIPERFSVQRWNKWAERKGRILAASSPLLDAFDSGDVVGFLRGCAAGRRTAWFGGATGAGKSFLMKTFLQLIPHTARLVVMQDARELFFPHRNYVLLMFNPAIPQMKLQHSALRMRPDYAIIGELRDPNAGWTQINDVCLGHPGSPSTIHGGTAPEMARRLYMLVKGSPEGRAIGDDTLIGMLTAAVDVLVPIAATGGVRSINEVWFKDDAERRGETFADLLRAS